MAKSDETEGAGKDGDGNVVNLPTTGMTPELLSELIEECTRYKAEMDTASGNLGSAMKSFESSTTSTAKPSSWR